MSKSPEISGLLDITSQSVFGRTRSDALLHGICVSCGEPIKQSDFEDQLSEKEYLISALCQKCQNKIFNFEEK